MDSRPILEVQHLKKYFSTPKGMLHAVDDVSFTIDAGKTLGVVGESGCGKSTLGRTILRLLAPTSGKVLFDGRDVYAANRREMRELRKEMQIIFQDPFASLDPHQTIAEAIAEPLKLSGEYRDKQVRETRISELMEMVGLAERFYDSYPHELDGGRRQRVGIARALALNSRFIVCDEPVSALDVSIQAQILNLLMELQERLGLTYIFITHDLSVVNHFSNDIAVMYMGRLIEKAPAEEMFQNPLHPYTQALLSAIPVPSLKNRRERIILQGELVSPVNPTKACRFAKRCRFATDRCQTCEPALIEYSAGHSAACFLHSEQAHDDSSGAGVAADNGVARR